jgi:transposase
MDALIGVKTVGQIAREYQIHPVQVTQWKGVIRDWLPELFTSPAGPDPDTQRLVAQLHEKIGELTVELDWLKTKSRQLGL